MRSPQRGRQTASGPQLPNLSGDPIYIVGLDRSGKTTLRAFLSSHSQIDIPAVGSNMWTYFFNRFGPLDDAANLAQCLAAMSHYKHVRFLEPDFARVRREFARGPHTYARLFSLFLMHHAEQEGKPRWGAQSGLVEQYADEMVEAWPSLKMIHMVRDPRDRYEASLAKWPDGRGRAGGAAARWHYSMRWAERNIRRYPDNYLIVRFEDLVTSTDATVRSACDFIGERFEPAMMSMGAAADFAGKLGSGPGDEAGPALSSDYVGRFRGRVPETELLFLQLHLAKAMKRHGYPTERIDLSPRSRLTFAARQWPSNYTRYLAWNAAETAHRRWPRRLGHRPGRRMQVDSDAPTEPGIDSAHIDRSDNQSIAGT